MAFPTDDEHGTIGLPSEAVREMLRDATRPPRSSPSPSPSPPPPRAARAEKARDDDPPLRPAPPSSAAGQPARALGRGLPPDTEPDIFSTAPLPAARGGPREARPSGPPSAPSRAPVPPSPARPAAPSSAPAPAPASPSPIRERPMDEDDWGTADLPGGLDRPGRAAPINNDPDLGVPFGGDTVYPPRSAPAPPRPASPAPPAENKAQRYDRHLTETPRQSSGFGTGPQTNAPAPPSRPNARPDRYDRLATSDGIGKTMAGDGLALVGSKTWSILQFYHNAFKQWYDLGMLQDEEKVLGRHTFQAWGPDPREIAEKHARIGFEGDELYIEPMETLNGVYRRLRPNCREPLPPGVSFRIGHYVLEFRPAGPRAEVAPLRSENGEVFQARVLSPLGFLDLVGPDRRPYLSFPLTKQNQSSTCIGRDGAECDIALIDDNWISRKHARIGYSDGAAWLEDLGSTNGTFLQVQGRAPFRRGTEMGPGSGDEVLVGGHKIRVVVKRT